MTVIHVQWKGPLSLLEVAKLGDEDSDYGVYQVYGRHPIYGANQLLYIGQACEQTFAVRIKQHEWNLWEADEGTVQVRIGRLHGKQTPSDEEWQSQIDWVEHLLINAHKPAHNSARIQDFSPESDLKLRDVHVLNWGDYGTLMPEVSGDRWTNKWVGDDYKAFGTHG